MPDYQTLEHDVLVIGAGGAGLRAAIEASAAGISVAIVCKSLLGKAHTVMAEGGIAAALANVDAQARAERRRSGLPRGSAGHPDIDRGTCDGMRGAVADCERDKTVCKPWAKLQSNE